MGSWYIILELLFRFYVFFLFWIVISGRAELCYIRFVFLRNFLNIVGVVYIVLKLYEGEGVDLAGVGRSG